MRRAPLPSSRSWGAAALVALTAVGAFTAAGRGAPGGGASSTAAQRARRCYGAAARDPGHQPCDNPRLRYAVRPRPSMAQITPNAPCTRRRRENLGLAHPCAFGVDPRTAAASIALIGDSHASHWRAALIPVARAKRWTGVSITRSSCPLSMATKRLGPAHRRACRRWNRDVRRWLTAHPDVSTVFQAQITSRIGVFVRRGQSEFDAEVDGYQAAWKTLPRSVRRIVVIRDTPKMVTDTPGCVMRAHAARSRPGPACARSRDAALTRDPLAVAAARARSRRIRLVNLTRYFCDPQVCFPVIGGVLVYKDNSHITRAYGATLGPFLLRRVAALTAHSVAKPVCFGAAARDPQRACVDPSSVTVTPSPADAPLLTAAPCAVEEQGDLLVVCALGAPAAEAVATVALVGDSHAGHWRAALDVVAQLKRWRVLSINRNGCPYSLAVQNTTEPLAAQCLQWAAEVARWFGHHPEVGTVFTGELANRDGVIPAPHVDELTAAVRGYVNAWRALPPSVTRVVVIRDNPHASTRTLPCLARVLAAGRRVAGACTLPRRRYLSPDPAAIAAARLRSARVHVADLTRFFCGRRRCFPVVGGVLVFKDMSHITSVFARTLGPFLLRILDRQGLG
jgi:hypothetical protein